MRRGVIPCFFIFRSVLKGQTTGPGSNCNFYYSFHKKLFIARFIDLCTLESLQRRMKLVIIIIFLIVSGWCDDTSDAEFIFSSNRIVRSIVEADHTERLHAMLVLGVNPDMISHAQIPLVLHAAVVQNVAAMKELCEFGANVNVVEADGWTPLMLTAGTVTTLFYSLSKLHNVYLIVKGNLEMINLLLEWNGNPFMSNYAGDTALTIANMHNHNEVCYNCRMMSLNICLIVDQIG